MRAPVAWVVCALALGALRPSSVAAQAGEVNPVDGQAYVRIPPGRFVMGCVARDPHCEPAETPAHEVEITKPSWMGRTEVTVGAFRRFVEATGYVPSSESGQDGVRGRIYLEGAGVTEVGWAWVDGVSWARPLDPARLAPDNWPAVQVTPRDAERFCRWAGGRLPTEAEWEYAARGGRDGAIHVWGDNETPAGESVSWANGPDLTTAERFPSMRTFAGYDDGFAALAPVGRFEPNTFGLYDMAGNAYEFTADAYAEDTYSATPRVDPTGPAIGLGRAVRGGSWGYEPEHHRISWRGYFSDASDFWTATLGFRCLLDEDPSK